MKYYIVEQSSWHYFDAIQKWHNFDAMVKFNIHQSAWHNFNTMVKFRSIQVNSSHMGESNGQSGFGPPSPIKKFVPSLFLRLSLNHSPPPTHTLHNLTIRYSIMDNEILQKYRKISQIYVSILKIQLEFNQKPINHEGMD